MKSRPVLKIYLWALVWVLAPLPPLNAQPTPTLERGASQEREASVPTILVVGDSISAAYGIQREQGWVALLADRLGPGGAYIINASVSGETTTGGVARLPRLLEHEPDLVVIELGGNDGLRGAPINRIRDNLMKMTEDTIAAGAIPLIVGMQIPPNYGPRYTDAFRDTFFQVAEATNSTIVPFFLEGVATEGNLMQDDGIHPTAAAQPLLVDIIWPYIESLLGDS